MAKPTRNSEERVAELLMQGTLDPIEQMRVRRPHLFSDSSTDSAPQLAREVLDHHLETLTSRKQENEFEHFARLLSEREICPNLRPQTGPTGGGDSKVDSETYPVATEIAERWYVGEANSAQERWAFAFSTKRTWKAKAQADIASILSTGRDYKRIYIITSRYARDKTRAEAEDALTEGAGIPVCILDRTWILEKVYANDRLGLAVESLGISGLSESRAKRLGPRDAAHEVELQELDRQISDPGRYEGTPYPLAEDCLRSALLARGLERPRDEVEARFAQAANIAVRGGYKQQILRIAYNRAWTAFWWYDDGAEFCRFYDEVETHATNSGQAYDLELVVNLWQLLGPLVLREKITTKAAQLSHRTAHLRSELERLAGISSRPNNALQAQTSLTVMQITPALASGDPVKLDQVWQGFGTIVREAELHGNYPIERLFSLLEEISQHMPDSAALDELLDDIIAAIEHRRSEGEGGKAYIQRGLQKLGKKRPYDAIRMFGRAESRLIKEEYREELLKTLYFASFAYERAGLLWAARSKVLAAAHLSLLSFEEEGKVIGQALKVIQRLIWLELVLGRVPQLLTAMEFSSILEAHLELSDEKKTELADERQVQEGVLGILLLNARLDQLKCLEKLPDTLERLGLVGASMALLWALGHENWLREDGFVPAEESSSELQKFFSSWDGQPAKTDLPAKPNLMAGDCVSLRTVVLGCEFLINAANNPTSVCIAEAVLSALESFFATSLDAKVMPYRENLTIDVSPVGDPKARLILKWVEDGGHIEALITHPMPLRFSSREEIVAYSEWLRDFLAEVIPKFIVVEDPAGWLENLAGKESGFSRAISLGNILTLTENIFGNTPKFNLESWIDANARRFPVRRSEVWNTRSSVESSGDRSPYQTGSGSPPEGLFDTEKMKHSDRQVSSVINLPLWEKARWRGTGFAEYGLTYPPCLALMFHDVEAGKLIFKEWRARFGQVDRDESIRIAVITGIEKENPAAYAVRISQALERAALKEGGQFISTSRINRMDAVDPLNLQRFFDAYKRENAFVIAPAQISKSGLAEINPKLGILKSKLVIRPAWEIGENDEDMIILKPGDEPVIPDDVADVPVLRALKRQSEWHS